jgi:BolA protein
VTITESIETNLASALSPTLLAVENESRMHAVPQGSESHFRVVVVSPIFEGKSRVARHQLVYRALAAELAGGVHALAITARTPAEWEAAPEPNVSPKCLGGSKKG